MAEEIGERLVTGVEHLVNDSARLVRPDLDLGVIEAEMGGDGSRLRPLFVISGRAREANREGAEATAVVGGGGRGDQSGIDAA